MDANVQEKIRALLNLQFAKRLLIRYFIQKGFADSFDAHIYAPSICNLPKEIPQFQGKIEIIPSVEEIDPTTNLLMVRWNMFVLGNHRLDLGTSTHKNVAEITGSCPTTSALPSKRTATPKQIISFIIDTLRNREAVYMDVTAMTAPIEPIIGPFGSSSFYQKKRPV